MTEAETPAVEALLGITLSDDCGSIVEEANHHGWCRVEVRGKDGSSLGVVVRLSAGADWTLES